MDVQGGTQHPALCLQVGRTPSQHHATKQPFIRDVVFTWKFGDQEAQFAYLVQPNAAL